jgi:hypothetical protein
VSGFRQQHTDPRFMPGLTDEQLFDVKHMCPEDGCVKPVSSGGVAIVANPFCPVCFGTGSITENRLDRWLVEQHQKARRGEL